MLKHILLSVFLLVPSLGYAQITVETITTDTIDLFTPAQNQVSQRSSAGAMALSLLVPGLGHQYTERPTAALAYMTFDILSLVGVIFAERNSRQLERDSRGFAALHAGTQGDVKNERFWQMVGAYQRTEDYNNDARLMRDLDNVYNEEKYYWYWNSDETKSMYNHMRDNSRRLHVVSSFCIGAMVLNRVVAFVDVRAATRYRKTRINTSFSVQPSLKNPGLTMSIDY